MNKILKEFEELSKDNISGSAEFLLHYVLLLQKGLDKGDLKSENDRNFILANLEKLRITHYPLFVLQHFINEIIHLLEPGNPKWATVLSNFLKTYTRIWITVNSKVARQADRILKPVNKTILLHSNSSTIYSLFRLWSENADQIKIIQTESRPVLEGRIQGEMLAKLGYEVKLVVDAAINRYLEETDMVLLGADAVYPDVFINKIGSFNIALNSNRLNKPLYVLTDSRKCWFNQIPEILDKPFNEPPKPGNEIWYSQLKILYWKIIISRKYQMILSVTSSWKTISLMGNKSKL